MFIFYGIGFSLYGKLSVSTIYLIALAIFAVQLVASHFYLKKFKQGPIEKVWRKVTYLK